MSQHFILDFSFLVLGADKIEYAMGQIRAALPLFLLVLNTLTISGMILRFIWLMVKRDLIQYCHNVCILCQFSLLNCELLPMFPNIEFIGMRSYDLFAVRCLLLPKKQKPILPILKEWVYHCITLTATFTFDWKVLILSLLPFLIVSLVAYLTV